MAPEYGATVGFFPVDEQDLAYLRLTGRPETWSRLVERYTKEQGLFRTRRDAATPDYSDNAGTRPRHRGAVLAGPKRPAGPGRALGDARAAGSPT